MKPFEREGPLRTLDAALVRHGEARASGAFFGAGLTGLAGGLAGTVFFHNPAFGMWGVMSFAALAFLSSRAPKLSFDRRRLDYTSAILAGLELPADAVVSLRVAFDPTEGPRHAVSRRRGLHRHDWLSMRVRFEPGLDLTIERAEELRIEASVDARGRRAHVFVPAAEDRITLRLPPPAEATAYRAGRELTFPASFSLSPPRGTEWVEEKREARELVLAFRDERPWEVGEVPEDGVDAAETTLRLLRRIAKAADLPPLARDPG